MNWKSKSLFSLAGITLTVMSAFAMFSYSQASIESKNAFCGNVEHAVMDQELPVSHPANRCAADHSKGVSWSEWFSGRSSSYQFHFIDLLELLSRSGSSDA